MSTCTLQMQGRIAATPAAYTMTVDGVQVHSGPVQSDLPLGSNITLLTMQNITTPGNLLASITVTTGVITLGPVSVLGPVETPDGADLRSNIKTNNANPSWPSDGGPTLPGGTPQDPDWIGWYFYQLGKDDTHTFDINVPMLPTRYVAFVNQPISVTTGSSTTFSLNMPNIDPQKPLPATVNWRVVNGTTSDSDFEAVTGSVVFATANNSLTINTVAQASPNPAKTFGLEIIATGGNVIGKSTRINLV